MSALEWLDAVRADLDVVSRFERELDERVTSREGRSVLAIASDLNDAHNAIDNSAPQIAAAAWAEGYAAAQLEWEHVYDGHTIDPDVDDQMCIECGKGNPYA